MSREKQDYRVTLAVIQAAYPGKITLNIKEACAVCGRERRSLLKDPAFPAQMIGGKYHINITALARYLS